MEENDLQHPAQGSSTCEVQLVTKERNTAESEYPAAGTPGDGDIVKGSCGSRK